MHQHGTVIKDRNLCVKAPKPKGLGLCFVAVRISEETSYICSTMGPKQPIQQKLTIYF